MLKICTGKCVHSEVCRLAKDYEKLVNGYENQEVDEAFSLEIRCRKFRMKYQNEMLSTEVFNVRELILGD